MENTFVNLHTHSFYSILAGTMPPKRILELAAERGSPAVALTDSGVGYGLLDFLEQSAKVEVNGDIRVTGTAPRIRFSETNTTNQNYEISLNNGNLQFQTNNDAFSSNSTKMTLLPNGEARFAPDCRQVNGPNQFDQSNAVCATNEYIMSGGGDCAVAADDYITINKPNLSQNRWEFKCRTRIGNNAVGQATAICCRKP